MTTGMSRPSRVLMTGPLSPFADAYALELRQRGYTPWTTARKLRQVARLSRWLESKGLTATDLSRGRVDEFRSFQRSTGGRFRTEWSQPALLCLVDLLRGYGVLAVEEPVRATSPTELLLASFERYLLTERGLRESTVRGYAADARGFLEGLSPVGNLADLTSRQVTEAVLRKSRAMSVSVTQAFVVSLRSFLRFSFIEGLIDVDLSQAALAVRFRNTPSLPRGITTVEASALLASCDRRTMLGLRDYAVITILLRLGLRAGEVSGLKLDDINWRVGELVVRGKGAREDRLPLPDDVGKAVASYLKRGRPPSNRREVFLLSRAPFGSMAPGTVSYCVRRACQRAGVAEVGSHRLRHTAACAMVSTHVPLVQISQVLRHRHLQSTAIYARVDLDQLRTVAAPWPGGVQ